MMLCVSIKQNLYLEILHCLYLSCHFKPKWRVKPCQASLMHCSSCSILLKCQNSVLNVGTIQKYQLVHCLPHLSFTLTHFRNELLCWNCFVQVLLRQLLQRNQTALSLLGLERPEYFNCLCNCLHQNSKNYFKV